LPVPFEVGALAANLLVGDDRTGLPFNDVGFDTIVSEEFRLFVDAVGVALIL